ncbi:MAG: peptide chain release factor 3 [Candidatus Delongbacteria bacterium]|jgi:peptide chain release factor 3|nr:peptide chain release factor 3 [Candidatus Delongbacteria bacterium]
MDRIQEIQRRRTFAIISHPDAGKTTLTEKLLLFGGAIRVAGAVKSNKIKKTATSDFMEIERQRGISVATSVMGFEYKDYKVNILDTPGHKDFAEDTFRTLTAADSVIVVIDVAKGVEQQTEKLVEVCKMRKTPMMFFINKLDRPGKDAFELLDEIELKLNCKVTPLSWPIGMGIDFKGVYNKYESKLDMFDRSSQVANNEGASVSVEDVNDKIFEDKLGDEVKKFREEFELIDGVYEEFDKDEYLNGDICPVFFGSALNNFGVRDLLNCFTEIAPHPQPVETDLKVMKPEDEKFSGFVFKIHANIDPNHRSRIAFVKVVSGMFERNKNYFHTKLKRNFKFNNPTSFMASKKEIVETAYPGDIVGIPDTGNFKIGDTFTEGEALNFVGIPNFAPEKFQYIENADPLKAKQLNKGILQLMDEGVAQLFIRTANNKKIIGTVGNLQFEVIKYRLEHEYSALSRFQPLSLYRACWITCDDDKKLKEFKQKNGFFIAEDKKGNDIFLAETAWSLQRAQEKFPDIHFHFKSEF